MKLYNQLSNDQRIALLEEAGEDRLTLSFYQYFKIEDPKAFRDELYKVWDKLGVLGRTYVASEGINSQISLPAPQLENFRTHLYSVDDALNDIRLNVAVEQDNMSFLKLKIKVRDKIVADGLEDESFDVTDIGVHLKAQDFNEIIEDENTVLIDMRNHYETEIGHFKGAITPDVDTFKQSLPIIEEDLKDHKEDKNLVMYCTGGIRCEKASAYYKHKGFKHVYQLEGGIIEYTNQVQAEGLENKFIGKNFVFDERRAERISDDVIAQCHQCGEPADTHVNCRNKACHLLFIQCDKCNTEMEGCCSNECKEIIHLPEEEQKNIRQGVEHGNHVFRKGRSGHIMKK
jgi:UPF0176 protein